MQIPVLEQFDVKRPKPDAAPVAASRDLSGLEAILDYAIMEGAEMRLPLFVCLLRLARMALKEEAEGTSTVNS
jgi:hypothetical protein